MPNVLLPTMLTTAVTDLTADFLKKQNIALLMLDFDNTIVPYTTNCPTDKMHSWLKAMADSEVRICIVSNSRRDRVKIFCREYGLDCITHARKPFSKGIQACIEKYNLSPQVCALAGDQIFTDTLGANCAGIRSILVKPINNHNIWLKLRHIAEKPFIFAARNRRIQE